MLGEGDGCVWTKKRGTRPTVYLKHKNSISFLGEVSIIVDRETGINYINSSIGNGNGLTVLLDEEGNPVRDQI